MSTINGLPFTVLDEFMLHLDRDGEPWTVQIEADVAHRLDPARVRVALTKALAQHPLARARRRPVTGIEREYIWEVCSDPDVDPLLTIECDHEDQLPALRRELYSTPIPLALAPPLRARLAQLRDRSVFMLSLSHVAADGIGAARLLRSFLSAYSGGEDPAARISLEEARALPQQLEPRGLHDRLRQLGHQSTLARQMLEEPARLAPDGGSPEPGYGFVHRTITPACLSRSARPAGASVNDVLLAVLHLTCQQWNDEHAAPAGRIALMMPVNLRPAAWRDDIVGNFALYMTISTCAAERANAYGCLRAIQRQTQALKEGQAATWLLPLLRTGKPLPIWLRRLVLPGVLLAARDRFVDTVVLSNLGRLTQPESLGRHPSVWFSPPARMPLGLALGVATVESRLHVAFRYRLALLNQSTAGRFADMFSDRLQRFP